MVNSGDTTLYYPSAYSGVTGVGAASNTDAVASFSTHNSSVDLSAPGVSVMSTMPTYTVALNGLGCTRNYSFMSGTSMACPIAAGVAALILSQKPNLDPDWWWRCPRTTPPVHCRLRPHPGGRVRPGHLHPLLLRLARRSGPSPGRGPTPAASR